MSHLLMVICQYTAGNANTFGQRTNREKKRIEKSADFQLDRTNFGQEGQLPSWYLKFIFYGWVVLYSMEYCRTQKVLAKMSLIL